MEDKTVHIILGVLGSVLVALEGALVHIFKRHVRENDELARVVAEHIKECTETPNSMILSVLRELKEDLDERHMQNTNMIASVNAELVNTRIKVAGLEASLKVR